jgi:hypothetical protein
VNHSTGEPTALEARRMDNFRLVGCVACWMLGHPDTPYDVHHQLSGGVRMGHFWTVPLCPAHHRGVDFSPSLHLASIARGQRTFREIFGSDEELLALTDRLIYIKLVQMQAPPNHFAFRNIPEALVAEKT